MTTVIGVSFKRAGKMYYFDPNGLELHIGDKAIVETARGMECGDVVTEVKEVEDDEVVQPLKTVIRAATEEDLKKIALNTRKEAEAFAIGQARIAHHQLEMKLVDVEYTFDVSKIIFYFTANGRIDFRELVKDLASIFKTRIELRQIGVRDEAKMIGGLGSCGRPICCRTFLGDFQPVSIKMAKEQNLLLNPTKISGLCGRLMCCLKYEQDTYDEVYHSVPRVGKEVITPDGRGIVSEVAVIREKIKVRMPGKDGAMEVHEYEFDQVQLAPKDGSQPQSVPAPAEPEKPAAEEQESVQSGEAAADSVQEEKPAAPAQGERTGDRPQRPRPPRSRNGGNRPPRRDGEAPRSGAQDGQSGEGRPQGSRPPRPQRNGNHNGGNNRRDGERPQGEGQNRQGGSPNGGNNNRRSRPPRQRTENGGVRTLPKEQRPVPETAAPSKGED